MEPRKQQLVDAAIDYLLAHGLAGLSLRPLATEIGTSARLLIYHFESKEGLLAEVLAAMQARLRGSFAAMTDAPARPHGEPLVMTFWKWATSRKQLPYLRLFYELQILAVQNPAVYAKYLKRNSVNWLELIQNALPPNERNPAMSTLLGAVFDGLFLELMSTGDRKRTTQALDTFIDIVLKARAATAAG
ncbi:MAG: TetR/AcrR family transcriptional regulator [Geothrix sp.]|nr:TetR/AcrR family transcriptional regulator [Geothrix sp.]